jgi:aspartate/methionine/tyrosine aminotransferase
MMNIAPFALERYFAQHEFSARFLLSCSDCEALSLSELVAMADEETSRLWREMKLGYTESQGHPLLREAIAELYEGIHAENALVLAPEEGIFLLMHALLEPGDHVVCTRPAYQSLHEVARSIGCDLSAWEPDEVRGWRFDVGKLKATLRENTRLVVVNFPHNPTGYVPSREEYQQIIDVVRDSGARLLSDEMYRFLELGEGLTLPAGCELYDRAVSLGGLSKSFGLPGLRMGWFATQDTELLTRIGMLKDYTTICHSAPSEILSIMALRNRSRIVNRQLERVRRNLTVLDGFFREYSDRFRWNRPGGGSVCFPRMLCVRDTLTFCEELVRDTGIMLFPSAMFQFGDNHVRIGFGRDNLPEAIDQFARYLDHRGW